MIDKSITPRLAKKDVSQHVSSDNNTVFSVLSNTADVQTVSLLGFYG